MLSQLAEQLPANRKTLPRQSQALVVESQNPDNQEIRKDPRLCGLTGTKQIGVYGS